MTENSPKYPSFFILGAEKCGTTSLYAYLGQHPNVCFSSPKEPIFFEAEYEKGLKYYWSRYFSTWDGQQAIGEARHRNLYLPYVPNRIRDSIADPKLIVILRNPVERAYSHWFRRYVSNLEDLPFEDAIREDIKRMERGINFEGKEGVQLWCQSLVPSSSTKGVAVSKDFRTYIDSGYYSLQIRRYLKLFPQENMRIVFLDDLARNPHQVISELWTFIGVAPGAQLTDDSPRNVSSSLLVANAIQYTRRAGILPILPRSAKKTGLWLLNRIGGHSPVISPAFKEFLISHYYQHNQDLEELSGRDLSHWNR